MREPAFWWRPPGLVSSLLAPLGAAYGIIAERRMTLRGSVAGVPVICVGNFTLGGTGKTPTALMLAAVLRDMGATPFFLTRGYGGSVEGPHPVDHDKDSAAQVGDEALLLARAAPTVVARDRVLGAAFAKAMGASVVIMDDGLQNPTLAKTLTIAVVDARRGIGNGQVFPAGPLRAPLNIQMTRCEALLVVGDGEAARPVVSRAGPRPVLRGRLTPDPAAVTALHARNVLAFAGIGDPDKFFATAEQSGIVIAQRRAFADHHRFSAEEAADLVMSAEREGLSLLTTAKDHARMAGDPALAALAAKAHVLPVTMVVEEKEALRRLLARALA
ncbi:tetraacyldisaccharide 4'-kinase [Undibacter mobilis]|uniref:Tetraacyldisaccharide 4'-kinase n=1 Tax=Undibacter mobilis TaxID=2292256 RepID=A0A371BBL0_9BRAD|nr:tetraacyldisaccharide 4'-kinase [Undibacter mobilis]RDV04940.1 tetraacyldisaccharide 4'-kinase [Undibacter mobilis]